MAPLILHNVPDDELYVGDDGVQRPYAMVFPQQQSNLGSFRSRRAAAEKGSFGKSTRRSRSKTGTPARREDPTAAAADRVFDNWLKQLGQDPLSVDQDPAAGPKHRKPSILPASQSQNSLTSPGDDDVAAAAGAATTAAPKTQARFGSATVVGRSEPTEVILRGYRSAAQQYAAVNHFETLAGRICEDYPRDPPAENRRYKSELRDPAYTRRRPLTADERAKANRADAGEHWVKVTFESAQAAESAMASSPQAILGHLVFAEPYHGAGPSRDEAVVDPSVNASTVASFSKHFAQEYGTGEAPRRRSSRLVSGAEPAPPSRYRPSAMSKTYQQQSDQQETSPPPSQSSFRTLDTDNTTTASSATVPPGGLSTGREPLWAMPAGGLDRDLYDTPRHNHHRHHNYNHHLQQQLQQQLDAPISSPNRQYCRTIPSARRLRLLPAEQALLPQPSITQQALNAVPFMRWFGGSMIGYEVPRSETGEFDWERASLYWKIVWWLDLFLGLFGGEIKNTDRDD